MGPLHEEARWLSDGEGMRCYFSEGDRRGPSRLECYRRLLAKPDEMKQGGYRSDLRLRLDEWRGRSPLEKAREKFWSMFGEVFQTRALR